MSKNKRFEPPIGFVLKVHNNIFHAKLLADKLQLPSYTVAKALDESGLLLIEDIMGISGDSAKVMLLQEQRGHTDGLKVVNNNESDIDSAVSGEQTEGTES